MIRRRHCLFAMFVPVIPVANAAGAATPAKVYRIGVLTSDRASEADIWDEFVAELSRRGYALDRNVVFERRFGVGNASLEKFARELVALKPDVIFAMSGTQSALAAKKASTTIPIVFYGSADPVGMGLVASLARPGGNLTGIAQGSLETFTKTLQYMKDILGRLTRVVQIQPVGVRSLPWFAAWDRASTAAALGLGTQYDYAEVGSMADVERAVVRAAREGVDAAAFVGGGGLFSTSSERVAALCVQHRLPTIGDPESGFLIQYGADPLGSSRKSAEYVDKILRGARPADLPVEMPSSFQLVVNRKTADAIGLRIPESILLRADRVIR